MGYSASVKMVYGVKLSTTDLEKRSSRRGCNHPQTAARFCQECGRPMFVEKTERVEFMDPIEAHYSDYEANERVVGIQVGPETQSMQAVKAFNPEELSQKILAACLEMELDVSGRPMALYQILVHSY